jgi:hypothetical protein
MDVNVNVGDVVIRFGWQVAAIAFSTLIIIGLLKPLIRKGVKVEAQRHAIYQGVEFALVFVFAWLVRAIEAWAIIPSQEIWTSAVAGYTVVNLIYPLYANLSVKELLTKIFNGVVSLLSKKDDADKTAVKAATTNTGESTNDKDKTQQGANDGEKQPVIVL